MLHSTQAKWFTLALILVALALWGATFWQSHRNGVEIVKIERFIGSQGPRGFRGKQGIQGIKGTTACPAGYHFALAKLSEKISGKEVIALVCIPNG